MKRLVAVLALPLIVMAIGVGAQDRSAPIRTYRHTFNVVEATIPEMQAALASGRVTSRELVLLYMSRIAQYDELLNATAYVSRTALDEAELLDEERARGRVRGPLHGIPIAVKDIINTTNMPTTGGALMLAGFVPKFEAPLVTRLREAGAVIIAKTVLTELANWVTVGMPANYSALFGYGMNPYDPRPDPRSGTNDGRAVMSTGGSSSGIGTAANLWAASVGTETSGSILSPSSATMLVGIKPTVGLISRYGIIPDHGRPGHRRTDGADGHRRSHPARRDDAASIRTTRRPTAARPGSTTRVTCCGPGSVAPASAFRAPTTTGRRSGRTPARWSAGWARRSWRSWKRPSRSCATRAR